MRASASSNHILEINANKYEVDEEGFLKDISDWSREVAEGMAAQDGIELEQAHWEVINFLRDYYFRYQIAPSFPRKRETCNAPIFLDSDTSDRRLRGNDFVYLRG